MLKIVLIISWLVGYGILVWRAWRWAFVLLVAVLPIYLIRLKIGGLPTTLLELMFWLLFVKWLIDKIKRQEFSAHFWRRRYFYPFGSGIIWLVLAAFVGLAVSGFSWSALGIYRAYFVEASLFFVLAFHFFKNPLNRPLVWRALAGSAIAIGLISIYQWINGEYWAGGGERITSIFPYPNAVGLFLGPIVVLLFFVAAENLRIKKAKEAVILGGGVILGLAAIVLAKSDGALIAVAVAIWLGLWGLGRRGAISAILIALAGLVFLGYNPQERENLWWQLALRNFSGEVRKQQWRETWQALKANGWLKGCGLANYQSCVRPFHQEGIFFNYERDPDFRRKIVIFDEKYKAQHWRPVEIYLYPHNFWLNFWSELSIIGLGATMFLVGQYFYFGLKLLRRRSSKIIIVGLLAAMVEILIHGAVDVPYFKNDLSFLWWLLFALLAVYEAEAKLWQKSSCKNT